jgi:hypothetical protein
MIIAGLLLLGVWFYLHRLGFYPSNSFGELSSLRFDQANSHGARSPASAILVSRQQVVPENLLKNQDSQIKPGQINRLQKFVAQGSNRQKQSATIPNFEKLLKFRTNKAFNVKAKGMDFYLLEGANAFQRVRLSDQDANGSGVVQYNEFIISDSPRDGGLSVAITRNGEDIVILSGLISIKVTDRRKLDIVAQKYELAPQRVFNHLGLGYYKPQKDLLTTYQQILSDPRIKEAKIEIVEQRMQKL